MPPFVSGRSVTFTLSAFCGSVGPVLLSQLWTRLHSGDSPTFGEFKGPILFGRQACKAIQPFDVALRENFEAACHRCDEMSDEFGIECIDRHAAGDPKLRELLAGAEHDRSKALLCFVEAEDVFVSAEHQKFAGNYRLGRYWRRFRAPTVEVAESDLTPARERALADSLVALSPDGIAPVVQLHASGAAGPDILATVYAAAGKHLEARIVGSGVTHRVVPTVVEFAVSYSANLGIVETTGKGFPVDKHGLVAARFVETVLGRKPGRLESLPPEQFNLGILRADRSLATDPNDGFKSCRAIELTCRAGNWGNLYTLRNLEGRVWARAWRELGADAVRHLRRRPPLSARIRAEWDPSPGYPKGKIVTFDIAAGSKEKGGSCSLRERAKAERLLLNTYFDRWGFRTPAE